MFHRVLAASVIGAAALAVPGTALAADSGGGGDTATPTSVAIHLPAHVQPGEPVTVTARITPQGTAQEPGTGPMQPGGHRGKGHSGTKGGKSGSKGGHHHKGTGHGAGHGTGHGSGHGTGHGVGHGKGKGRHHTVTGEVRFFLDGKAEPPVEVSRDQASEKLEIPLGRHTLVAEYSGDADYLAARSAPVSFELAPGQGDQGQGQGQDEGPGQGPDGLGQDQPDAPDQGAGQYGPGQVDQNQGDQSDQGDQEQDGQDGQDQGVDQDSGQDAPQGADQA
jgi:PAX-interacting protein 1